MIVGPAVDLAMQANTACKSSRQGIDGIDALHMIAQEGTKAVVRVGAGKHDVGQVVHLILRAGPDAFVTRVGAIAVTLAETIAVTMDMMPKVAEFAARLVGLSCASVSGLEALK